MKVISFIILLCLFGEVQSNPFIVSDVGQYHKTNTMVNYNVKRGILVVNNIDVLSQYYVSGKFKLITDIPAIVFELVEYNYVHEFENPEWQDKHYSFFDGKILTIEYLTIDDDSNIWDEHWNVELKHLGGNIFELINLNKVK